MGSFNENSLKDLRQIIKFVVHGGVLRTCFAFSSLVLIDRLIYLSFQVCFCLRGIVDNLKFQLSTRFAEYALNFTVRFTCCGIDNTSFVGELASGRRSREENRAEVNEKSPSLIWSLVEKSVRLPKKYFDWIKFYTR